MNPYQMSPLERAAYIAQLIESMREMVYPSAPKTSEPWDRNRRSRLNTMAQTIKLTGGKVRPEISE
jgi:hypothetical protein